MRTAQNGASLRLSPETRSRLEQDVAEIKAQLENVATKRDIQEVKDLVNSRADDILKAISWKRSRAG